MDRWCVLLDEPPVGRGGPSVRPVRYGASREEALQQALDFAREYEPLEPARIDGRQIFRMAGGTLLIGFDGSSERYVHLHVVENLT